MDVGGNLTVGGVGSGPLVTVNGAGSSPTMAVTGSVEITGSLIMDNLVVYNGMTGGVFKVGPGPYTPINTTSDTLNYVAYNSAYGGTQIIISGMNGAGQNIFLKKGLSVTFLTSYINTAAAQAKFGCDIAGVDTSYLLSGNTTVHNTFEVTASSTPVTQTVYLKEGVHYKSTDIYLWFQLGSSTVGAQGYFWWPTVSVLGIL